MFALLEVVLRATGRQAEFFFEMDPEVGVIHIPGKAGWFVFADGRQYIEINSHGYRDVEREMVKPPHTYRIALLGDSFVEALQVPQERTFGAILERRLTAECGRFAGVEFEVLNFGVSGFGTAQELETLRYRASRFAPDFVLLMFYASNDLFDNSRELDVEPNRLHYELDEEGRLVRLPFAITDNGVKRWLRRHSLAYSFLRERVNRLAALRQALTTLSLVQEQDDPDEVDRRRAERVLSNIQFLRNPTDAVERAWRLASALIVETHRLSIGYGARFVVASIPNRDEIRSYSAAAATDGRSDYQQSQRRLESMCAEHGIACLNLAASFGSEAATEYYFPADGHWTPRGHSAVATAVFDWISPTLPGCRAVALEETPTPGPATRR
jgi:lysophospholipase L1-like esterase